MADLKTTNIYGDAYINNKVGIATNAPATRLQIGQLSPTAATEGIQFGDDTSARLHRINTGHIRATGGFSSATFVIADNYLQTNNNLIYPASQTATQRLEVGNAANNAWIDGLTIAPGGNVVIAGNLSVSSGTITSNYGTFAAPGLIIGDAQYGFYVSGGNVYYKSASGGVHYWRNIANSANVLSLDNSGNLVASGNGTFSGDLSIAGNYQIRNSEPTITLRDTNHRTAYIHVNSNIFHILTGPADSAFGNWAIVANGRWPLEINLSNNNATFGADVNAISFTGAGTGLTGTAASLTAGAVTNGVYTGTNNTYTNGNFFQSNLGTTSGVLSSPPLQVYATGTNSAFMSFHRAGSFAVNFGLDSDNVLRIGGWSAAANRLQLDMSGNLTLAGVVDATQFRDSANTAYYVDPASTSNLNALTVAGGNATIYRDLIVNGGGSGNFGNRIIVQGTATTYTYQDTTLRPTVYLNGDYPVVTLNATATTNANHGPTLQFAFNGLTTGGATSRQIVIGANGVGSWLDFGFSGGANGDNSSYNPHNGISGYNGVTAMRLFSNGLLVGSTGAYPNHITSISYALDVRGTGYFSSTLTVGGNISAANLSGTNTGDQSIGNGTITIAAGTGVSVGATNTFTTNQSGATTVTVTNSGVTSLAGTTNRVTVSGATGAVTLNLPQDIHTGASPTFSGLSLTSVSTTGATITNLTGAYQNTTVYDSAKTQSATPSRGIRAPASSIQFTDSYAIAPFYTYRSTGDWPVPYGIGWGTGGESSGIFQRYASNGSSFGDMIFYTGNDGSGAFSFRRHTWEGTAHFAAGSGELNTELFRVDWSGNVSMLGTLNGSANSATLYPNNGPYGSWKIGGTRGGWYGIEFESGTILMANSSESGFYRNGVGWQMWWSGGTGYVQKGGSGGGTQATILESSNYTSYTPGLGTNNTLTGINTINNTSNTVINTLSGNLGLTMFQATAGTDAYMTFHIGSDYAAYFGLGGAENDLVYGGWSAGNNRHRILHSGNATYAWNMNQFVRTTDSPTFNTVTANITGNAYNNLSNDYKDIYVYGDVNTYYVVLIQGDYLYSFGRYSVTRGYNWQGPDTWYIASHKGGLTLDWEWSGDTAWGGNDKAIRIIEFNESYSSTVAGLGYPVNGGVIIWLRGGGVGGALYRIRTPVGSNATVTVYDNLSIANHVASTTFTAANSSVFTTRADTNNVSAEILARYPVRSSGGLFNDGNAVLHVGNYNSYSPTLTGTGASGTWSINVTGNAGGSSTSCTGNAGTATTLQTARTINGTSFNGSAAITTATWGTARTLTIGSTGKSVDGSAAITWSLAEIGAAATNQTMFVGTTSVAINRASAAQTLTGISIDGNAATVTNATFYRQFTVRDDRSDGSNYSLAGRPTGLYAINAAGTNGPGTTYLSLIHVANSNDVAFQIAGGYNSDAMYFRGTTALQSGTGYSAWRTVIHSGNIASQTVTSCTGNAATATGQQSAVHFTLNTGGAGYGLVGQYNPDVHQAIFAMGTGYTLAAGGTLANFYGVSWSYDYSGRQLNTGYNLQHCLAIANAGLVRTVIGVGIWTNGLIRANGDISSGGTITATTFSGAGTSLTGTAASLNIGGGATFLNSSNYIQRIGGSGNYNTDFQNTPAGSVRHQGDDANSISNPGATWWFVDNYRHSNSSNYWGTQVAWGWEDNANRLATRNVSAGGYGGWVYYLNSANYNSYSPTLTGTGASGTWSINVTGTAATATTATTTTGNAGSVTYLPGRTDAAAYPVLWGAAYTNAVGTIAYSCAAVTIQSSTGTLFATTFSGAGTGLTGTATSLSIGGSAASLVSANTYTVGNLTVNSMAQLVGVKETYVAVAPTGGSNIVTIDLNAGTVFRLNYNAFVGSFTLSNVTAGKVNSFTLISIPAAGAGGITFTFTGYTLKWAGGTVPTATTTAGKFDVFSFVFDGTNWYGFTGGLNY